MDKRWPVIQLPQFSTFSVAEAPRRFTDCYGYKITLTVTPLRDARFPTPSYHDQIVYGCEVSNIVAEDTRALAFIARQMIHDTFVKFFGIEEEKL
jgi:hypothetical protein